MLARTLSRVARATPSCAASRVLCPSAKRRISTSAITHISTSQTTHVRAFSIESTMTPPTSAAAALDAVIKTLEDQLGIAPGAPLPDESASKKSKNEKNASGNAAPSSSGKAQAKPKENKKAKAEASAPHADENQPEITKLDIRVGQIVKVWKHETADKLYCEEIEVGEEAPRQIASGLVPHYSLEEMQNRRILVLCNLKAKNLVGFKSHGMVMCAVKQQEDGSEKVAFVEPPVDAKIGERVVFEGLSGEPITPAQVEKKKVFQNVLPDLTTDAEGIARWKEHAFSTSAGPCVAPLQSGLIR